MASSEKLAFGRIPHHQFRKLAWAVLWFKPVRVASAPSHTHLYQFLQSNKTWSAQRRTAMAAGVSRHLSSFTLGLFQYWHFRSGGGSCTKPNCLRMATLHLIQGACKCMSSWLVLSLCIGHRTQNKRRPAAKYLVRNLFNFCTRAL